MYVSASGQKARLVEDRNESQIRRLEHCKASTRLTVME